MIRPTVLSAALWAVLSPAYAETPTLAEPHDFDRVQVTATRTERAASDVAATVDVIDREQLDRQLVQDIRDLVRYEPGVSVTRSAARFGLGGFRIRGLDGNRVLIQVDGVRVPDGFSFGAQAAGRGDYVDLGLVKSVEILRGPSSALYGSGAPGGEQSWRERDIGFLYSESVKRCFSSPATMAA